MARKFLIKLNQVHRNSGKSTYRVAKESGLVYNTVKKYTDRPIEVDYISPEIAQLADYYGVDWRDPNIIEIIDEDESDTRPIPTVHEDEDEEEDSPVRVR
ncbi:MAG: hypothetical protein K8L99_26195 [Anaerolineae bacterium]|nr:hypothetical protein [Anaerolineae bacterium]